MKQTMMKTFAVAGALMISGAAFTASAGERLRVNVPFSFVVGNTQFAPGEYRVEQGDNGLLTLQGAKNAAMVITTPSDAAKFGPASLHFTNANSRAYLTSVQLEGMAVRSLPTNTTVKLTMASAK